MKSPTNKRQELECPWCGKTFYRYPSQITGKNTCSRKCLGAQQSKKHNPEGYTEARNTSAMGKHLPELNRKLNPGRMTPEVRAKLRASRLGTGEGKGYEKTYGRHTHRIVMERKIGRPLTSDEIVHHIDGDHRNNDPDNLMVVTRQEHIQIHRAQGDMERKKRAV